MCGRDRGANAVYCDGCNDRRNERFRRRNAVAKLAVALGKLAVLYA